MAAAVSAALPPPAAAPALRHGFNRAPTCDSGASVAAQLPLLGATVARTHDLRALDWWTIFPDPAADTEDPAAFDFSAGDAAFAAILAAGQEPYFRLGTSWPPGPPPVPAWSLLPDPRVFARVSVHILEHYNDAAWAGGFAGRRIRYVEIWNEPDGKNPLMYAGTVEQFYALFNATAFAVKLYDPSLKVGGPGVAHVADASMAADLVAFLKRAGTPFDFFSYPYYASGAARPLEARSTAEAVRSALNALGLAAVEVHVSEWNTDATPRNTQRDSALAAAFVASALSSFARSNVSVATFYPACAGLGPSSWGLFQDDGSGTVSWRRESFAYLVAGQTLRDYPRAITAASVPANTDSTILAGASNAGAGGAYNVSVVVSTQSPRFNGVSLTVTDLPPSAPVRVMAELIDDAHTLDVVQDSTSRTDASGTLVASIGFSSPAVVRVRLSI
jgi:hypothetical protein